MASILYNLIFPYKPCRNHTTQNPNYVRVFWAKNTAVQKCQWASFSFTSMVAFVRETERERKVEEICSRFKSWNMSHHLLLLLLSSAALDIKVGSCMRGPPSTRWTATTASLGPTAWPSSPPSASWLWQAPAQRVRINPCGYVKGLIGIERTNERPWLRHKIHAQGI